jgi:hypothetical protein
MKVIGCVMCIWGNCRKISKEDAVQQARKLKGEALGLLGPRRETKEKERS